MSISKLKVLVYGGTGSQGGAVVQNLLEQGHIPHILSRHPAKAAHWQQAGAVIATGDLADRYSLEAASAQVDAVALMTPAFLEDPAQAPQFTRNAIDAAKVGGVKLLVYNTSGPVISQRTGNPAFDMRVELLDYLEKSGVPFVVIQPTAYMENLLGPWTRPQVVERDRLAYPVSEEVPLGWIATRDVGALIAAALERPELAGNQFVVSGLENVTGPQLAEHFSRGLGRPVTYYPMPLEEFGAALDTAFGPGAGEGGMQAYKFQQDNAHLLTMWTDMHGVLEKLPVKMTSLAEWSAQHKAAFSRTDGQPISG